MGAFPVRRVCLRPTMRRLPKISKGTKGKNVRRVIDYSSTDKAQETAPWTNAEEWLGDGVEQEESGERYQHGQKARRHFTNASVCYEIAAQLDAANFDACYNW